jgi:hypothetical protein
MPRTSPILTELLRQRSEIDAQIQTLNSKRQLIEELLAAKPAAERKQRKAKATTTATAQPQPTATT